MDDTDDNSPLITLPELQEICNLLKVASDRGAFRIEEYQRVGICYNKLQTFLTRAHEITRQGEQNV